MRKLVGRNMMKALDLGLRDAHTARSTRVTHPRVLGDKLRLRPAPHSSLPLGAAPLLPLAPPPHLLTTSHSHASRSRFHSVSSTVTTGAKAVHAPPSQAPADAPVLGEKHLVTLTDSCPPTASEQGRGGCGRRAGHFHVETTCVPFLWEPHQCFEFYDRNFFPLMILEGKYSWFNKSLWLNFFLQN